MLGLQHCQRFSALTTKSLVRLRRIAHSKASRTWYRYPTIDGAAPKVEMLCGIMVDASCLEFELRHCNTRHAGPVEQRDLRSLAALGRVGEYHPLLGAAECGAKTDSYIDRLLDVTPPGVVIEPGENDGVVVLALTLAQSNQRQS